MRTVSRSIELPGLVLALALSLSGCCHCQTLPSHVQVAPSASAAGANMLFPLGNYRHDVKIHIEPTSGAKAQDFSFQGLAQVGRDQLEVVVLSPFQTTLMKVSENRVSGDVQTEIYSDSLRKYQDRISKYYSLLRQILVLTRQGLDDPTEVTLVPDPSQSLANATSETVKFSDYRNHVPHVVELSDPHFTLVMKVEPL